MDYYTLKHIHMGCAALSGSLFLLRGCWMLADSPKLQQRWVKVAPHIIDSLLLLSALTMVFMSAQYPFVQGWLTAKVLALLVYIGLGTVAIKRGKTKSARVAALFAALVTFAYIAAVAVKKTPFPFL
ncbi:SirB2 family protein [Massilia sp. NR 4-1]|uniref:SirB2 family protein n=1 Tax=Massilia sp. NR 4-1 TaxID=1678028 RepID=UPI00067D3470|nr:SirB2 family protein [Massilia sp. NR 4-1]AKU20530.1 regulator SirB [Massilia sp. NR 4-1]